MAFWNRNNEKKDDAQVQSGTNAVPQSLADNLYKQNIEIASKNKSLSILRNLYEISIMTLEPGRMAERICQLIQSEMSFELVGIVLHNDTEDQAGAHTLQPLSFTTSERLSNVLGTLSVHIGTLKFSQSEHSLAGEVIKGKKSLNTEDLVEIWGDSVSRADYKKITTDGHLRSVIISPLIIENRVIGLSFFGMNRGYDSMSDHEIETIGNFSNIIAVSLDRSLLYQQLKKTNTELGQANDRLKVLDKQKTEFVSLASHQLRGPLTAISGYVELVLTGDYGKISEEVSGALQKVQSSVRDLALLVNDYLDVTRIELGRMKYDFEDISLVQIAEEVVYEMKPAIEKSQLELQTHLSPKALQVHVDRNKIKQVMLNLVDNAIKYSGEGAITITVTEENGKAVFSVRDTGTGISPDVLPTLFEKFVRAPGAQKVNASGTGLGLFVAKKILDEHKGKIWAESDGLGKGAKFSFAVELV